MARYHRADDASKVGWYDAVMTCSSCGAPMDATGLFPGASVPCACGASTRVPMPPSVRSESSEPAARVSDAPNACPRCDDVLEVRHSERLVVAGCARGHGIFMTHAVLREAKGEGIAEVTALDVAPTERKDEIVDPAGAPPCRCPRCGDPMTHRALARGADAPVVVDVCSAHGTWFDAGELRAALAVRAAPERDEDLDKRAAATLDVALAFEQTREADAMRDAVDTVDDLLDTFNVLFLGRGHRRRRWSR